MMKKRLLSAVMASAMVLSLAACGGAKTETTAAETTAEKKEETTTAGTTAAETAEAAGGTLIVGFDQDFPPMGFVGDNGEYTGFDLDLAKEVASRLGLEYKAQPVAWDSKDMELESGNIDCIWNGFTITGREDDYTWTTPYMANKQVFVVANDSDIKSQADLIIPHSWISNRVRLTQSQWTLSLQATRSSRETRTLRSLTIPSPRKNMALALRRATQS